MNNIITIKGRNYVARYVELPFEQAISSGLQLVPNARLVMPGVAPFLLRGLKGTTLVGGVVTARAFKFRFGNTDGGIWYAQAGQGGTNDRILNSLIFGTGQFPKVIDPPIIFQPSASIPMEFEDVSNNAPYTISLSFEGCWLFDE